ncbi:trichohyalin isoform X3 [Magallana gigas]|uniref:trichohyalin isoform X3 n=1 Tax=Magallana gigas TaxID=29159 RepID=UPI00333F4AAA
MCAAMVDRNPEYPDYGRPMYDSNPQNDYGRPAYESYQQPGDYRRGQEYGQERYNPTSQYPGSSDPPVPDDLQITSGLVSLSDEKAKERRHLIQMEMRKEYEDHMRRQKPVYYTTGSVDDGLPIGNYAQARKVLDTERHRDYNKYMKEKEEQANRHRDEMVRQQHASPPHPANQTEMYDHNQMSQQLREERRKEYNDYLKLKENLEHESAGRPVTPPGGLALGGYEVYRNQLKKDRVREYRQSLLKKEANGTPRAPPTPPVGLNIPTEAERHKIAELKKRQYRDELLRQQKEQILNRAQHQLEIPVIDRRQPNSDPPPPINPPQDRPPSGRWDPQSYRQSNFDQVKRVTSPPHQANIGHDDYGAFRRQTEHEVRNKEYNDFLAKKQHLEDEKKQKLADQRRQAPAPIVKGDYYDSEQYDRRRQALNDLQHREYQNYLKNQPATPPEAYGLPIGQQHYTPKQKWMEKQRNMEYNQLLRKQGDPSNQTSAPHSYGTSLPMVESELKYNEFRKKQEKQRNWDYNVLLKHDQQRNRAPTPDHLQGLPLSQRQYDSMRKMQEKQRNQEYNDLLAKKGFNQHQPPETNRRPELGLKSEFQDQYQDPAALLTNRGRYSLELEQYSSRLDNQARSNFDSHVQIAPQAISSDQVRTNSGKVKYYGLMTETQEQYRNPVTKNLDKGPKMGKEPAGRQSQRNAPVGSLIAGDRVDYPSSANERFNRERRKDYNDYIKPQDLKNIHRKREEAIAKIESDGIDMDKVRIFPQGEYVEKQKQLQEEWRKNFRDFAAKKYEIVKKDLQERERVLASYNQKEIDNPTILPAGEYKEKQKHLQQQWRDECRDYYLGHPVVQRSKEIWREDEPVHTIPQSGEYKGRRKRLDAQLQKEFKEYQSQKTPPKERVKEFGSQGAVLFDPVYNKDVKNRMREERSKDLKDFLEKQEADRFRKQENTRPDNRIGFMTHLGRPVEEMREKLAKERHEEYNKYLKDKYISQPHQRPLERPKWVDSKVMEDNWQKEAAGSRSRPTSDKPIHTPTYEEMLDKKRREEASYRRFDDPEYSRSGADRGYDAQYRRYDQ